MAVNIYDISRKAGVSTATVSRVLNNSPHVREETRRKVMAVIEQCGYVPNAFARGLGKNSMKTIGLLCPDASDPFLSSALAMLEGAFRSRGYDCLLCCTGSNREERMQGVEKLISRHVDGMVLMGSVFSEAKEQDARYIREAAQSIPMVIFNGMVNGSNVYCVGCDDYDVSGRAVEHLLDSGCRRILYLYLSDHYSGSRKLAAYRDVLEQRGIEVDPRLICRVPDHCSDPRQARAVLMELAKAGVDFDAVYTSEDVLAAGAIKYAAAAGKRVPEDLSVIGYDNSILCTVCEPEISSVDNRSSAICEHIVTTMLGVLEGREMPQKTIFAGELIHRSSTRRIP